MMTVVGSREQGKRSDERSGDKRYRERKIMELSKEQLDPRCRGLSDGELRGRKSVCLCLAIHFNRKTGRCGPALETIARYCFMGVSTVRRHLRTMEDDGLLVRRAAGR